MRGEFLDLSGARIYYYAAGTRGAGVPVVLIHGFPTSSHLWSELVPLLPPGHRIVVLDLLGFGRSDPPYEADLSLAGHAGRLIEVFNVLGIAKACVVGHGLGGGIAQSAATRYPDRVSHLGLLNTIALDGWMSMKIKLARVFAPLTRHLPASIIMSEVRNALLGGYSDRDIGNRSLDMYLRPFATKEGRDALVRHLLALDARETVAIAERLRDMDVPAAVIWGGRDPVLPPLVGERLHQAIRGSSFLCIDGARHFTPEEAPHPVADALAALLERGGPGPTIE
jgi:pimeloyl-ACP methyl ester carboxylesterase